MSSRRAADWEMPLWKISGSQRVLDRSGSVVSFFRVSFRVAAASATDAMADARAFLTDSAVGGMPEYRADLVLRVSREKAANRWVVVRQGRQ